MNPQRVVKAFGLAIVLSVVLPFIPIVRYLLLPFDYLNTHLHELCHATAAVLTGGRVDHIEVYANASGVTYTYGGINVIVRMAGYLGASLIGSAMIQTTRSERGAKRWLFGLGSVVLLGNLIWVRGDYVGWPLGILWPIVIFFLATKLKGENLLFAAQFLGVQQCLNAIKSLRDLLLLSSGTGIVTDAQLMADDTHVPAIVWALLWTGLSVYGIILATLRIGRLRKGQSPVAAKEPDTV